MTKVFETQTTMHDIPGTPDEIVEKAQLLGWIIAEEEGNRVILTHPLLAGMSRVVHR